MDTTNPPGGRLRGNAPGLRVQHEATLLAQSVYRATAGFPDSERASLGDQMRRASVSVPANIAEGAGRATRTDRARFYTMAWASLRELEAHVRVAHAVDLLDQPTLARLAQHCRHTGRLLHALRHSPNL